MAHGRGRDSDVAGSKTQCPPVRRWALLCKRACHPGSPWGVQGGGRHPLRGSSPSPRHPPCQSYQEAVRTHEPVSAVSGGAGAVPASTVSIHRLPPGVGVGGLPIPAPPVVSFHAPRPQARAVRTPAGGDPVAQRRRPREGSRPIPGLTPPEDKRLETAASSGRPAPLRADPLSRLRCSPVVLIPAPARPERCSFLPRVSAGERRPKGSQPLSLPTRPLQGAFSPSAERRHPDGEERRVALGSTKSCRLCTRDWRVPGPPPKTHPMASVLPLCLQGCLNHLSTLHHG